MKTNKNISEETLYKLFNEIPLDDSSPDFMENLLQRIEQEIVASEKRKSNWMVAGQMAAGLFGILVLPALAIYLCTIFLPDYSFSMPKIQINFDTNLIVIAFSILILLITDTLLRMYIANRAKNDS